MTKKQKPDISRIGFFVSTLNHHLREEHMKYFSKGKLLLHWKKGLKMTGELSPWLRFCIGLSILMFAFGYGILGNIQPVLEFLR